MPVAWNEVEGGVAIDDFRIDNAPARVAAVGDLWAPVLARKGRAKLDPLL
jgi:bifunctional non-homologous end joining protein LigD